jgi:hypothetical protein
MPCFSLTLLPRCKQDDKSHIARLEACKSVGGASLATVTHWHIRTLDSNEICEKQNDNKLKQNNCIVF